MQRTQWLQTVAKEPLHHQQYLAAVFSKFGLGGQSDLVHPWLEQMVEDLSHVAMLDGQGWVEEEVDETLTACERL